MLFTTVTFLIFFAIVLFIHYLPISWRLKKLNLLLSSYVFYAAWNPPFVLLLWTSTLIDWTVGKHLHRAEGDRRRKILLLVSLAANLGMLGFFKYGGFLLDTFVNVMACIGVQFEPLKFDVVLPVGISFYTFQTLSYTLDIYFKRLKPSKSFLDYAMYVTFFPQLVAGPIVRAIEFIPQCAEPRRADSRQFGWGLSLLTLGLFEKIVIADRLLAPIVEKVYDSQAASNVLDAWCGTFAFAGQIFCDFAGYSTCAIGTAMCLGFALPDNFRFPYGAIGFSDFWGRWHISLSSWLRDYLYIPLGGNRKGVARTYANLMYTMLLGGLWHGASWTFVFWGGLHGVYLIGERLVSGSVATLSVWSLPGIRHVIKPFLCAFTFGLVCFTWVFFRAHSFGKAFEISGSMLGVDSSNPGMELASFERVLAVALMGLVWLIHWLMRNTTVEDVASRFPSWVRAVVLSGMLVLVITLFAGEDRAFIYFQF